MTECNGLPLLFSSLERRKIVADFRGGDLTSDGGLPLLREVDRRIGLIDALDAAINDPLFPPKTSSAGNRRAKRAHLGGMIGA